MAPDAPLADPVHQNIEGILTFHRREDDKLTAAERRLERLSGGSCSAQGFAVAGDAATSLGGWRPMVQFRFIRTW